MQHNLVQSNGASVKQTREDEQYEFIVEECLLRLRWGKMLAITHERVDFLVSEIVLDLIQKVATNTPQSMQVVKQLMIFGKLRVPDIISTLGGDTDAIRASIPLKGKCANRYSGAEAITGSVIALLQNHFLQTTAPELQILESDQIARRFAASKRRLAQAQGSALLSANDITNCRLEAAHDVRTVNESLRAITRVLITKPKVDKNAKRRKTGKAIEESDYELKQDVHLRLNYDRYGVLMRNDLIVKAAEDRWNKGAGIVMRAVLDASLRDTSLLKDDRTHDPVGINSIISLIPPSSAPILLAGLGLSSKSSIPDLVRAYLSVLAGEDQLTGTGAGAFLQREGSTNPGYKVEFEAICVKMREAMLSDLVREKLGDKAARVLAVVTRSSKAFETTVSSILCFSCYSPKH